VSGFSSAPEEPLSSLLYLSASAGGIFLIAGLWTPVTGALIALDELWIASFLYFSARGGGWTHVLLAVMGASMAMLGPGAWSIDARRFGRKRFDIDPSRDKRPSH
jgi:putative oxidoreductase